MSYNVFVDGLEGTTGLEILHRLESRKELNLLRIDPERRKDPSERKRFINSADIVFLCLPDDAAKESVSFVENSKTCIIDASTAHRIDATWVYGLPELSTKQRDYIRESKRISVPGCHATGFITVVGPLVRSGIIPSSALTSCFSITGYSGGGKKLISYYETDLSNRNRENLPRMYALSLQHKHLPEMAFHTGLTSPPVFSPILANIYKGMLVSVPIQLAQLNGVTSAIEIHQILSSHYAGERFVKVMPFGGENALDEGYLEPTQCNGTNRLELFVFGGSTQALVSARFDNLGKGASGAAVQCMNIHLGLHEDEGLPG